MCIIGHAWTNVFLVNLGPTNLAAPGRNQQTMVLTLLIFETTSLHVHGQLSSMFFLNQNYFAVGRIVEMGVFHMDRQHLSRRRKKLGWKCPC